MYIRQRIALAYLQSNEIRNENGKLFFHVVVALCCFRCARVIYTLMVKHLFERMKGTGAEKEEKSSRRCRAALQSNGRAVHAENVCCPALPFLDPM